MRFSGTNDGYTMFRGSVKSAGYPLNSPVSPSLPLPSVTVNVKCVSEFIEYMQRLTQYYVSIKPRM